MIESASFVVLDTVAFCPATLGHVCDPDSLSGFYTFEEWFELTEDLVVVCADRINSLEVILSVLGSHFEDDAPLKGLIGGCVDFCKSVSYNVLTMQGLSRGLYQSLASFVPGTFLFQNLDVLLLPNIHTCAVLHANGSISEHLENAVPVQFVTAVRSWRDEEPDCVELEFYSVVCLWLKRERGDCRPVLATFFVCCAPWGIISCLFTSHANWMSSL